MRLCPGLEPAQYFLASCGELGKLELVRLGNCPFPRFNKPLAKSFPLQNVPLSGRILWLYFKMATFCFPYQKHEGVFLGFHDENLWVSCR